MLHRSFNLSSSSMDVAGMCVMYKAHRMQLLELAELRLNPRAKPSLLPVRPTTSIIR
ncbi:hypothetical protein GWK47_039545 [Chionoecetes opilio]|uniref:Uncharacterized protein n=1 Tax=Chionoecetes opilio TaxID=41210 RepID=A0A8J4YCZ5_CHIOP|nr:hypothetical protein GWK47_039545 [Chionoecetes opilio]